MGRPVRRRLAFLFAGNLILLFTIFALLKEGSSFTEILGRIGPDIAPAALAAFALTGIIFTGAIDLSIASMIALAGTIFGCFATRGYSPVLSFAICAVSAWSLMSFNGLLVTRLNMPAIIVTLAGLPLYRGIALIIADSFIPSFCLTAATTPPVPEWARADWRLLITVVFADSFSWRFRFDRRCLRTWLAE